MLLLWVVGGVGLCRLSAVAVAGKGGLVAASCAPKGVLFGAIGRFPKTPVRNFGSLGYLVTNDFSGMRLFSAA